MNHECSKRILAILLLASFAVIVLVSGCAKPPYSGKPEVMPPVKYCNSAIGHIKGSKPFIMGGTCVCTPTQKLLEQYQADGFCQGMTLADLVKMYNDRGVHTDLDHSHCNNKCQWGPHVVFGGKCMATPTPGTANFEAVISGIPERLFKSIYKAKKNAGAIQL